MDTVVGHVDNMGQREEVKFQNLSKKKRGGGQSHSLLGLLQCFTPWSDPSGSLAGFDPC